MSYAPAQAKRGRGGIGAAHRARVAQLVKEDGCSTIGMRDALAAALGGCPIARAELRRIGKIPDAYEIHHERKLLIVHEVVVAHGGGPEGYVPLWRVLDSRGWRLGIAIHTETRLVSVFPHEDMALVAAGRMDVLLRRAMEVLRP